jgi:TRAP-type C4-dicarboxylate transport system substrate-binding protein
MHRMHARTRLTIAVVTAAIVASACSNDGVNPDKAGGSGEPVVLRMANTSGELGLQPAVEYFAHRVEEISGGDVRIESVDQWGGFASDAEQQVVEAVSNGNVDLGWVGTRVFDTLGVTSFRALTAPMLVDSYALQNAVIESGITDEMMEALDDVGVVGLAVLADGLRKPIGVSGPIVTPADWDGMTFGTLPSNGQADAIRALGATPAEVFGAEREEALDTGTIQGFEFALLNYSTPAWPPRAPYVTANVNLWPQMDVLLANPDGLATLTEEQEGWLRRAAADAAARSADLADRDVQLLTFVCESGARFANASEADLAALRQTFAPLYSTLEQDRQTKEFIERIVELKHSTPPEPQLVLPPGCTGAAPAASAGGPERVASDLNGIYRWTITSEDVLASVTEDKSPEHLATFPWVFTMTLEDGTWKLTHTEAGQPFTDNPGASYSIEGDRISFDWGEEGIILTFTISAHEDGVLELRPVEPMSAGEQFVWATHPWTKIG